MACADCKTIPPVIVEGYVEGGEWIEVGGFKAYITGPKTATKAVIAAYDIFGPKPQTLQGADGLAKALGALVIVPDFLKGRYAKPQYFGKMTEEEEREKAAYFSFAFNFPEHKQSLLAISEATKTKFSSIEAWGAYGLCWGGKVVALTSGADTPFKVTGQVHPAGLSVDDAKAMTIPHVCLASSGEDAKVVQEYKQVLMGEGKPGYVELYADQQHGWMGARANFKDARNLEEYQRGYNKLAEFFGKYLASGGSKI